MARKRLIAPEFFTHGDLYDAERESRLPLRVAFSGLWTQCDRRGLFRWRPRELKLAILPYDNVDFGEVLGALAAHGFIVRYTVDGKEYGRVPSFGQWQSFHPHEKGASDIPEPPTVGTESTDVGDEPTKVGPEPTKVGLNRSAVITAVTPTPTPTPTNNTKATRGKPAPWMGEINRVWGEVFPEAKAPTGAAKMLSPIVDRFGIERVAAELGVYLRATQPQFLSLPKFTATFGGSAVAGSIAPAKTEAERAAESVWALCKKYGFAQCTRTTIDGELQRALDAGDIDDVESFRAKLRKLDIPFLRAVQSDKAAVRSIAERLAA